MSWVCALKVIALTYSKLSPSKMLYLNLLLKTPTKKTV